ncbi:hypothetical protein G6F58_002692 [Rhizopus delemar]|nr:hypothetical protein G6F58_002692 [Rhizopus delemar]
MLLMQQNGSKSLATNISSVILLIFCTCYGTQTTSEHFFNNMNLQGFGEFCSRNGIEFAKSKDKRRRTSPSDHVQRWQARVLAQDYEENLAKDITMYDQQYHIFISKQKQTGHTIVGYVRKSTGGEIQRMKERLPQKTIDKIKIRSCVDKVYVSYSSSASHLLPGEITAETTESD